MSTLAEADYKAVAITEAAEGTFKLALYQAKLGTTLYADGTVNGSEYLATTDKYAKAADVIVAKSGEGYTLKVGDKFIEIYENTNAKIRIRLVAESTGVWAWNTDAKVFTWTISGTEKNDGEYYLGTYNTYNTLSASKVSYITGDNAANVGVSQFPAQLGDKDFVADEPEKQPTAQEIIDGIEMPADAYGDITLSSEATWTVKEGTAIAIEGGVAKVTRGAEDATVVLTATVTIGEDVATKDFTIVVKAEIVGDVTATVDLATNFGTYAKSWSNSYAVKTLSASDLGVDTMPLEVVFSNVSKQTATITTLPVIASKSAAEQYVTISVAGMSIKSVTFNLKEWTTAKKFTKITIEYTTDGTTWTPTNVGLVNGEATAIGTDYATLSATELPANVSAVRLVVLGNSSDKNQQVGIAGFTVVAGK